MEGPEPQQQFRRQPEWQGMHDRDGGRGQSGTCIMPALIMGEAEEIRGCFCTACRQCGLNLEYPLAHYDASLLQSVRSFNFSHTLNINPSSPICLFHVK